jgi:hypothetical protein
MPLLLLLWVKFGVVCTRLVGGAFLALAALKGGAMAAVVPKPLCSLGRRPPVQSDPVPLYRRFIRRKMSTISTITVTRM